MRNVKLLVALAAAFSLIFAISCGDDDGGGGEICNNLVDDDFDGLVDCGDSDCTNTAYCSNPCGDGTCDVAGGENAATCPAILPRLFALKLALT